jgi:hypothetical protein
MNARAEAAFLNLLNLNSLLIKLSPRLFGCQGVVRAQALPTIKSLLALAGQTSDRKGAVAA